MSCDLFRVLYDWVTYIKQTPSEEMSGVPIQLSGDQGHDINSVTSYLVCIEVYVL